MESTLIAVVVTRVRYVSINRTSRKFDRDFIRIKF